MTIYKASKMTLRLLVTTVVACAALLQTSPATTTGTVSFSGGVTAYQNTNGTGANSSDFTQDHSLVFSGIVVNSYAPLNTAAFTGLGGSSVTIYSPLQFNPIATPPVPISNVLWSINGTQFKFTASTMVETISGSPNPNTYLNLFATGTMSDGTPAVWNAVFTSATFGQSTTFSFSANAQCGPAPIVTTLVASNLTSSSATFDGTVNPNGWGTTAYFQYGTSTNYGSTNASQYIGNGTNTVAVTTNITGLTPSTTYHYRTVAVAGMILYYGTDQVFTTSPPFHPILLTAINGNQLSIDWNTNNATGFGLESTSSLTPPFSWNTVTNTPVLVSNQWTVTIPISGQSQFFRLTN